MRSHAQNVKLSKCQGCFTSSQLTASPRLELSTTEASLTNVTSDCGNSKLGICAKMFVAVAKNYQKALTVFTITKRYLKE